MIQKLLPFCLILTLGLLNTEAFSQCIYTSQPDPTSGIDATCWKYPICKRPSGLARPCDTTNRGTSEHLYISSRQVGGIDQVMRSFVKFDMAVFGKMAKKCWPTSATVNLYYYKTAATDDQHITESGSNAMYLQRVTEPWTQDTIRWQYPVMSNNLRMPKVSNGKTAKDRVYIPQTASPTQDFTIDLTKMVEFWIQYPDSNFGFRLMLEDESTGRQVHLASSNSTDPSIRPKITVDFPCSDAFAGNDTLVCIGDQIIFQPSGGASYQWSPDNAANDILSNYGIPHPILVPTKDQSFTVEAKIGTCKSTSQIKITTALPSPGDITSVDTFICIGDSVELFATGGTFYEWFPKSSLSTPTKSSTWAKPTGTTTYLVEVSSAGDVCPGKDTVVITVKSLTVASLEFSDTTLCKGDSVMLKASGGSIYSWTPTSQLSNSTVGNPWASPQVETTYKVIVSNPNACPDSAEVHINVTVGGVADAGPDVSICDGDTTVLTAIGSGTINWTPNATIDDPFSKNPKAFPKTTTTYILRTYGISSTCSGIDSITVTVNPKPNVKVNTTDTLVCEEEEVTLIATGGAEYFWSTAEKSDKIVVKNKESSEVWLYGTDGTCFSDSIFISANTQRCTGNLVDIPNIFSPNGDGIHDQWVIKYINNYENVQVMVMNKWGDIVMNRKPYMNDWDGTYLGQEVAEDTYMYLVKFNFKDKDWVYTGSITIVR